MKPEWLDDVLLNTSSSDARVLSIAFILMADDYGNGRFDKIQTSLKVFPPADDSLECLGTSTRQFREAMERLVKIRFVGLYIVNEQTYFTIRNWSVHQVVNHPGKPLVPRPKSDFWSPSRESPETLGESPESLFPRAGHDLPAGSPSRTNQQDLDQYPARAPTPVPAPAREADQQPSRTPTDKPGLTSAELCEKTFTQPTHTSLGLFEAWKAESGKTGARLDWSRRALFDRLVQEGVTVQEVTLATRGARKDEWATKKARLDPTAILGTAGQREKFIDLEQSDRSERATSAGKYPVFKDEKPVDAVPPPPDQLDNVAKVLGIRPSHSRIKVNGASTPSPVVSAPSVVVPPVRTVRSVPPMTDAELAERRTRGLEGLRELDAKGAAESSEHGGLEPVLEA